MLSAAARQAVQIKPSAAKVGLGEKLRILVTESIYSRFHGKVSVRLRPDLVPGKLVVEVEPDDKHGTHSWTPIMPGQRVLQMPPDKVKNCGESFPKFGMTPPDSVIWGRDNVLRITLPGNRPPLSPRRTKTVDPKDRRKPVKTKEKPKEKKVTEDDTGLIKLRRAAVKGITASHSPSGVRIYVEGELKREMVPRLWVVDTISQAGEGRDKVTLIKITTRKGRFRVGRLDEKKKKQYITLCDVDPTLPQFGMSPVVEVQHSEDWNEIIFILSGVLRAPMTKTRRPKAESSPAAIAPEALSRPAPQVDGDLATLRRLRDEINECVRKMREQGDEVTLWVKESGDIGFRYEG